ncbi:Protein FAR1-RELATED SEQUENCE 11 [Bienertia sinuspersici]
MLEAIEIDLPTTKHSFCIWHITSKFSSWFAALLRTAYQYWCANFYEFYKTTIAKEFEHKWNVMVYKRMIITGRSESINTFIKKLVSSDVSLTDFVKQLQNFLIVGHTLSSHTSSILPHKLFKDSSLYLPLLWYYNASEASSVVQEGDMHSISNQIVLHTTYEVQGDSAELEEESNIVNNASSDENIVYLPLKSKTKGRPKRGVRRVEKNLGKKTKCCSICKQPGHTKATCPNKEDNFSLKEMKEGASSTSHKRY